jgi:hypothetical protein
MRPGSDSLPPGPGAPQSLAEVLVEANLIGASQLEQVRRAAQRSGSSVVSTLLDQGIVEEEALVQALRDRLELALFDVASTEVEPDAIREIPHDQASRFRLLPVRIDRSGNDERLLVVAMADPLDTQAIEEIEFASGCMVQPLIARPSELADAIRIHYRHVVTKVIPRQASAAPGSRRRPRAPFGGTLAESDLRTKPVRRIQQEASPAHRVDALVALLVRKGLVTQEEYEDQLRAIVHPREDDSHHEE